MRKFFILVRKEIKELITIQAILPLIIMISMFGIIGSVVSRETEKLKQPQIIWVVDQDGSGYSERILDILPNSNFNVTVFREKDIDTVLSLAKEKNISSLLVIPSGFGRGIETLSPQKLRIYNLLEDFSLTASAKYELINRAVNAISIDVSNQWIERYDIPVKGSDLRSPVRKNEFVVINERSANISLDQVTSFITQQTTFIPIVLFMVIIIAAQMVAAAIVTEKENKTLETLLSSPINRKTIVFAKLFGAGLVALLFASVYMFGFKYYMNSMMGDAAAASTSELMQILSTLGVTISSTGYILLGTSLFMGILVALAIAIILGILADDTKSLHVVTAPLMIMIVFPYILVLFLNPNTIAPIAKYLIYAIPFSHPFLAIQKIMTHEYMFIIYGIVYQLVVFVLFVVLAAKIFSSDKILTIRLKFGRKKKSSLGK
jgi:ABC-2 type transport system permease protein